MKLIYINDELATGDGSNSHAVGMLRSFEEILGKENVKSYPQAEDGSKKPINLKAGKLKAKLKGPLQIIRFFRKKFLSVKRSRSIISDLNREGFIPTHVIARSTVFDITAIYVAKAFKAKLVYEINTPMFYECGVIKKDPLIRAIEKWEKKILEASNYVYIVSSICRDMLCTQYGIEKDKFLVIPNGYMGELYIETQNERERIRNEIRKKEKIGDKFVVTFLGSLKVWHGIDSFCKIAAQLDKNDDICFLVLGDGDMHDMIAEYADNHSNMLFKGKVSLEVMKQYLYASDLGIMPYENKANFYYSPLKMFDMIGAGLPFIGTAVGQIEEYCYRNLNKEFLCINPSVAEYEQMITELQKNRKKFSVMQNKVRIIRNKCTWESRALELLQSIGYVHVV